MATNSSHVLGTKFFDLLYTGGTFTTADNTAIVDLALVVFDLLFLFVVNMWMAMKVGKARKEAGVDYPNLYAYAGGTHIYKHEGSTSTNSTAEAGSLLKKGSGITQEVADKYNAVQRAHQNTLEQMNMFLPMLIIGSFGFPAISAIFGFIWVTSRVFYASGYYVRPKARVIGAAIGFLIKFAFFGLIFALMVYIAQGKAPIRF